MEAFFTTLGRGVYLHRRAIVMVWLLALVGGYFLASGIPGVLREEVSGASSSESVRAQHILETEFASRLDRPLLLVLSSPSRTVDDPEFSRAIEALTLRLLRSPYVARVFNHANTGETAMVSRDRRATYLVITLAGVPQEEVIARTVPAIRAEVAKVLRPSDLSADLTGADPVIADFLAVSVADASRIIKTAHPLALIVLILVFGGVVGASLMLVMGAVSILLASAVAVILGHYAFDGIPTFSLVMVTMLGLSTGIDYSLIVLTRFREEREAGADIPAAVTRAVATAGRTVAFAGCLVITGLLFLYVPDLRVARITAATSASVVFLAVIGALTLLPALLPALAGWLDAPRFLSDRLRRLHLRAFWVGWSGYVTGWPWRALLVALPIFAVLAAPVLSLRLWEAGVTAAPRYLESSRGYESLKGILSGGEIDPIYLLVKVPAGHKLWTTETVEALTALSHSLRREPMVARVESPVDLDPTLTRSDYLKLYASGNDPTDGPVGTLIGALVNIRHGADTVLFKITPREASSLAVRTFIQQLREHLLPAQPRLAGYTLLVGGSSAQLIDLEHALYHPLSGMIAGYVLTVYILLLVLFRSVVLPIKAILLNSLPVMAALGTVTLVVQHGYGSGWLGFESPGAVLIQTPVILFLILFGLSMDYEVLILARVREEYDGGRPTVEAVAWGLARSATIITGGAAIMLTIFLPFVASPLIPTREIGIGMAVGVLLDATLVRFFLVPAAMVLLDRWNWWFPGGSNCG